MPCFNLTVNPCLAFSTLSKIMVQSNQFLKHGRIYQSLIAN
ncbi:hypothetical protein E9M_06705 [Moraxella catarrhalis 46P47B1]|uniref:Uncharacterized protein n=1 Tax=Moraxella catarrhalis TaxID=480 RepID=A0A3S9QCX5_MORCA|nr:hypothetical protein EJK52_1890 [Moraxella catarrhalis]EGE09884.1 hypothetical protein E9G_09030 [Moraxella catarrhalis 7169]EGE11636.1 hypothetical protein E9M_06705 [Moraxella catarrhalis 46P47B1]EGE17926.1 hypothetical protein E9O_00280 [Moraxella catarrhalis 12P80B1]EGE18258.1 hypothetical protein E9U_09070 [Moraxella catarrhalis BC8]EGE22182.1 hypothetical protein E9S_01079 [Moraxella catarrhalis BC7]EGE22804.1 hypothetical protein E9W_07935 [Moraxella catarrhalis CO72]EGE23695.1 hyp